MKKTVAGIALASLLGLGAAQAAPVQWTVASGGNGHWYEAISSPNTSWTAARAAAEARGGYLATITSAAENTFVAALVPDSGSAESPYWLGGLRVSTSTNPNDGFVHVTPSRLSA